MKRTGIIIFATEFAKKNYKKEDKKIKKSSCPSCEIKIRKQKAVTHFNDEITEEMLTN